MDAASQHAAWKSAAAWLLVAVVLAVLPESLVASLRDLVRMALVPGQRVMQTGSDWLAVRAAALVSDRLAERDRQIERLRTDLATAQLTARRTALRLQAQKKEIDSLNRHGPSPFAVRPVSPLVRAQAVEARVLGADTVAAWKAQRLLDRGTAAGLARDQWILDAAKTVIDAGLDQSLSPGLPVFAGRCVVGRVVEAGRWTSSLELLTSPSFRARAVLVRDGTDGPETAGAGLIEGAGQGQCRVVEVGAQFDVSVGDAVYSAGDPVARTPMLFGFVTAATLEPGALHWDIRVKPAADLNRLRTVQVVVPGTNPDRLLGQR